MEYDVVGRISPLSAEAATHSSETILSVVLMACRNLARRGSLTLWCSSVLKTKTSTLWRLSPAPMTMAPLASSCYTHINVNIIQGEKQSTATSTQKTNPSLTSTRPARALSSNPLRATVRACSLLGGFPFSARVVSLLVIVFNARGRPEPGPERGGRRSRCDRRAIVWKGEGMM